LRILKLPKEVAFSQHGDRDFGAKGSGPGSGLQRIRRQQQRRLQQQRQQQQQQQQQRQQQ